MKTAALLFIASSLVGSTIAGFGTCGNGVSCPAGLCCSRQGYCGQTAEYCSIEKGCQSSFGSCFGPQTTSSQSITTTMQPTTTTTMTTTSSMQPTTTTATATQTSTVTPTSTMIPSNITGLNQCTTNSISGPFCPTGSCCRLGGMCGRGSDFCSPAICLYGACDGGDVDPIEAIQNSTVVPIGMRNALDRMTQRMENTNDNAALKTSLATLLLGMTLALV